MSKLVCFYCDKEFSGVQVLHSHQKKCGLTSNSQKILTDTRSSVGKKRSFLSYLNLLPKVNAEHVHPERRRDVVLDVIVIDDDSDDENRAVTKEKSQRYLLSPNSLDSKMKQNGRIHWKSKNGGLALRNAFAKPSSKVFKFDISSPLGMRLRYHCKEIGNCRLPISKICRANYELYCGMSTTKRSNRCYPVTYRKSRQQSTFCHRYKFTRAQLREACRAQNSGLSLSSFRLKRQMKPCRVSLERLNLLCEDTLSGTFDAKKYMRMLNLKLDAESSARVSDEEVEIKRSQTLVNAQEEASAVRPNGFLSIFDGWQVSESCQSGVNKMRDSLERPTKGIRTFQTFRLRGPDARSTADVFSPVVSSSNPRLAGWANRHAENPPAFARNVEFVPLSALYELEIENHDPQTPMFEISSVYSLATTEDSAMSPSRDFLEQQHHSNSIAPLVESLPLQKIPSSASSADVITIVDHDNSSLDAAGQSSQIKEQQSVFHGLKNSATDVIDLTQNVSSSIPVGSEATATIPKQTVVEMGHRSASDVRRHLSTEKSCSPSSDKLRKSPDVHKLPSEKSSDQQTSHLLRELERPIVIEIPDEDSAVFTKQHRNHATQSHNNVSNGNNSNASAISNSLLNSDRSCTLPSQRLLDKSSHSVPPACHLVQPPVPACGRNGVQANDTIDLSVDSDTEVLDKEPVATGQKRPLLSNSDSCPPRKRDRPGVPLEHSFLPALTFKCHICGCCFNFDNNSGTMIRKHYLTHNVTNIELVKQMLPNGQTTWSLVELNNVGQSTHSKSGPATCASSPPTSISQNSVSVEASSMRPSVTMHHALSSATLPAASSSRSAARQSNALPEFVPLQQSYIPESFSSYPEVSSAKQRSSPNNTRLNSDKNCNMLPSGHLLSPHALTVTDLDTADVVSSSPNDTVLSQAGHQERNDVRFNRQTVEAIALRAAHLDRFRPNVLSSTRVLRPNVPSSTRILQPNAQSSTLVLARTVPPASSTSVEQRQQIYFPTSADLNRMLVNGESGDTNVPKQMQSKHNALASIKSNNNIVHGVICLD